MAGQKIRFEKLTHSWLTLAMVLRLTHNIVQILHSGLYLHWDLFNEFLHVSVLQWGSEYRTIRYLNGQKEVGWQMVWYLNAI